MEELIFIYLYSNKITYSEVVTLLMEHGIIGINHKELSNEED